MGGAIPFGLGIALSNPSLDVIVISGDGALAMNLGSLITVVAGGATNLTVVVLDNGIYEVTGGQKTAASIADVDFVSLAESVGFRSAFRFDEETEWRRRGTIVLNAPGPRFVSLSVENALPDDMATAAPPISNQLHGLSAAIKKRLCST
jgi:thiamine pyrophosphate-dependent acetolactate synthase large subunit-like protein